MKEQALAARRSVLPVQPGNRLIELDVLRGFALFGILLANMLFFSFPYMHKALTGTTYWDGWLDKAVAGFIRIAVEGHFITMLSFLFGVGFVMFLEKAQASGRKTTGLFVKRMLGLLAIGLAHAFLLWSGDILVYYAIAGLVLLMFRHSTSRGLLVGALLFTLIPIVLVALMVSLLAGVDTTNDPLMQGQLQQWLAEERKLMDVYANGTYGEIIEARKIELKLAYTGTIFTALPFMLGLFLLGAYVGRKGYFQQLSAHAGLVNKVWIWSLIMGVPFSIIKQIGYQQMNPNVTTYYDFYQILGMYIGDPAICFFLITSILMLLRKERWLKAFRFLANVGRMPLTIYLMQSLIATTIFYGYGFGLFGLSPRWLPLWAIAIFAFQAAFSHLWFRTYKFGPVEAIWRVWTYGRLSASQRSKEKHVSA